MRNELKWPVSTWLPLFILITTALISCEKFTDWFPVSNHQTDPYNLDVTLSGSDDRSGFIKFRQDKDPTGIVRLDTRVHHLLPNHEYQLQRAVDTDLDGNCTGTNWLTLGAGLDALSITTNDKGDGSAALWRNLSAIPSGSRFDIHFQLIDVADAKVVLSSGCYQYTVR